MELQFENGIDLNGRQAVRDRPCDFAFESCNSILPAIQLDAFNLPGLAVFRDGDVLLGKIVEQVLLGIGAARGTADDPNNGIQMVKSDLITDEDMLALLGFAQLESRAAQHNVATVLEKQLDERNQSQFTRLAGHDGKQDHAERFLHLRELEKIVEDELRFFPALDFDDDAHALARRFVANVGDAFDFLGLHQFGDALDQPRFVDLIWNFRDYDIFAVFADFLDGRLGAHHEAAASRFVGGFDALAACDVRAGRKIRTGHNLHDFFQWRIRL